MKTHKAIIAKASKLHADLEEKIEASLKADRQLAKLQDGIAAIRGEISEVESEAAEAGLAVSDLNEALDEMRKAK